MARPRNPNPTKRQKLQEQFVKLRANAEAAKKRDTDRSDSWKIAVRDATRNAIVTRFQGQHHDTESLKNIVNAINGSILNGTLPINLNEDTIRLGLGLAPKGQNPPQQPQPAGEAQQCMASLYRDATHNYLAGLGIQLPALPPLPARPGHELPDLNDNNPLTNPHRASDLAMREALAAATVAAINSFNADSELKKSLNVANANQSPTVQALAGAEQKRQGNLHNSITQALGNIPADVCKDLLNFEIKSAENNLRKSYEEAASINAFLQPASTPLTTEVLDKAAEALEFKNISDRMQTNVRMLSQAQTAYTQIHQLVTVTDQNLFRAYPLTDMELKVAATALAAARNDQTQIEAKYQLRAEAIAAHFGAQNAARIQNQNNPETLRVLLGKVVGEAAKTAALKFPDNEEVVRRAAYTAAETFINNQNMNDKTELANLAKIQADASATQQANNPVGLPPIPRGADRFTNLETSLHHKQAQPQNRIPLPEQKDLNPLLQAVNTHYITPLKEEIEPAQEQEIQYIDQNIAARQISDQYTIVRDQLGIERIWIPDDELNDQAVGNNHDSKLVAGADVKIKNIASGHTYTAHLVEQGDKITLNYIPYEDKTPNLTAGQVKAEFARQVEQAQSVVAAFIKAKTDKGLPAGSIKPKIINDSVIALMRAVIGGPGANPNPKSLPIKFEFKDEAQEKAYERFLIKAQKGIRENTSWGGLLTSVKNVFVKGREQKYKDAYDDFKRWQSHNKKIDDDAKALRDTHEAKPAPIRPAAVGGVHQNPPPHIPPNNPLPHNNNLGQQHQADPNQHLGGPGVHQQPVQDPHNQGLNQPPLEVKGQNQDDELEGDEADLFEDEGESVVEANDAKLSQTEEAKKETKLDHAQQSESRARPTELDLSSPPSVEHKDQQTPGSNLSSPASSFEQPSSNRGSVMRSPHQNYLPNQARGHEESKRSGRGLLNSGSDNAPLVGQDLPPTIARSAVTESKEKQGQQSQPSSEVVVEQPTTPTRGLRR